MTAIAGSGPPRPKRPACEAARQAEEPEAEAGT